ncbi:hypothetical protein IFM89_006697 [Coptis chinensis]|uniref:NLP1-9 GAF domain-containing protein n=1 Tax=Coptis chinensis TaxID=261450 RepID=A0A835IUA7_9MAGN|nr:hypothetical protein IFM89_006697 [Coptis chinensis]
MWVLAALGRASLLRRAGVGGRAFSSKSSCFSSDMTQLSKSEYPLVHYARMFGLSSCFAICLRSTYTGLSGCDDYILELFLPPGTTALSKHLIFLDSVLVTMKASNITGRTSIAIRSILFFLVCMANLGQQQFVVSFNRSSFSSAAAALSLSNNNNNNNTDKEQKMACAEQLVSELSNPDLRENALLDLSKVLYLI